MKSAVKCPLCPSEAIVAYGRWPGFEVLECRRCGFRFIDTASPEYPRNAQYVYDEAEIGPIRPHLPHIQRRVRDILRFRTPKGLSLDIGCGRGEVALALAGRGFKASGVDMKPRLIGHLQEKHPEVSWRVATTEQLTTLDERFDVVSLYHVLEHVPRPKAALANVRALVKPGGLIVIEVPNVGGWEARLKGRRWHYYKVDHVSYFRASDLIRLAEEAGLEVLDVRGYQHFSHPQNVLWKDVIKGTMARLGFQDVISVFLRAGEA